MPGVLRPAIASRTSGVSTNAQSASVLVGDSGGASSNADFVSRRTSPGVIRWFDFDNATQLGGGYGANFGNLSNSNDSLNLPQLDTIVKASGTASLRFDIRSQSFFDGEWWANFSADLLTQFGSPGDAFYVQVRTRWNQAFYDTYFLQDAAHGGGVQAGTKFFDVSPGDTAAVIYGSSTAPKTVIQTYYQERFAQAYGYDSVGNNQPMFETFGGDFKLQNAMPSPFCLYSVASPQSGTGGAVAGCFNIVPNEWITWQIGINITGRRVVNGFSCLDYRMRLWVAREGRVSELAIDFGQATPGYFPLLAEEGGVQTKFGKVNLFPYMTNKDATQVTGLCQCWYDELIISTQQIPDPAVSAANFPSLASNTVQDLGAYNCVDLVGDPAGSCLIVTDFSGMIHDSARNRMILFGGGHASTNYNAVNMFPLATRGWVADYLATPCNELTVANYDYNLGAFVSGASGPYPRPAARHTEDLMVVVNDELILLTNVEGNGTTGCGIGNNLLFLAPNSKICHYNLTSKTWTFTSATTPANEYPAASYDPLSGKVILLGQTALDIYDPIAKTRTRIGNIACKDEANIALSQDLLGYNNNIVYFPPDNRHYLFDRFTGDVFRIDLDRNNFANTVAVRLTTSGTKPSAPETGYAYDATNQLIGGALLDNAFFAFNPATKVWTHQTVAGGAPGTLAYHAIDYSPADNVYIFVTNGASGRRTWAYRWA